MSPRRSAKAWTRGGTAVDRSCRVLDKDLSAMAVTLTGLKDNLLCVTDQPRHRLEAAVDRHEPGSCDPALSHHGGEQARLIVCRDEVRPLPRRSARSAVHAAEFLGQIAWQGTRHNHVRYRAANAQPRVSQMGRNRTVQRSMELPRFLGPKAALHHRAQRTQRAPRNVSAETRIADAAAQGAARATPHRTAAPRRYFFGAIRFCIRSRTYRPLSL